MKTTTVPALYRSPAIAECVARLDANLRRMSPTREVEWEAWMQEQVDLRRQFEQLVAPIRSTLCARCEGRGVINSNHSGGRCYLCGGTGDAK